MDGIALASVISSAVVGVAAIVGSALGVRWAAALDRHNWIHERKVEAYIEIVQAVERQGEILSAQSRARAFPDIVEDSTYEEAAPNDAARLSALERIYASPSLQQALGSWRYCVTQIAELLSYPDDSAEDIVDTRTTLFGDLTKEDQSGMLQDERGARDAVIEVVATELGQRDDRIAA